MHAAFRAKDYLRAKYVRHKLTLYKRMRKTFVAILIFWTAASVHAQTLVKIGPEEISVPEFLWIYKKSNASPLKYDEKSLKNYLDLYINFRLKVLEAESRGMDKDPDFKSELASYRNRLAERYLLEREVSDKLVTEAYQRSRKMINASHILILCAPEAPPADTLKAFQKISQIRKEILAGASFEDQAVKYSEEPGAASRKGYLGNFSVFQMVYPFENAAFNTPPGQVSNIVRSRFGYHLIKVNSVSPHPGQIRVAHIMVAVSPGMSPADSLLAFNKAKEIYRRAKAGENFALLVHQYSDDRNSVSKDGVLPPLSLGQTLKPFEEAAFSLKKNGDIAGPVRTDYGWHIIKLIGKLPPPTFNQAKNLIQSRVAADERSALGQDQFIERLKKEYHFQDVSGSKYLAAAAVDEGAGKDRELVLFTINNEPVILQEFKRFMTENRSGTAEPKDIAGHYRDFILQKLTTLENKHLEEHYPDFRYLLNEYRNGILLYNISEEKLWRKAQEDADSLQKFFEANADKYCWNERADAKVYIANSRQNLAQTKLLLQQNLSDEAILRKINQTNPLNLVINEGLYERGDHLFVDKARWLRNSQSEAAVGNAYALVKIRDIVPPTNKKLDDVRADVLSDYQNYLEQQWLKDLREKYPVVINAPELKKLVK